MLTIRGGEGERGKKVGGGGGGEGERERGEGGGGGGGGGAYYTNVSDDVVDQKGWLVEQNSISFGLSLGRCLSSPFLWAQCFASLNVALS